MFALLHARTHGEKTKRARAQANHELKGKKSGSFSDFSFWLFKSGKSSKSNMNVCNVISMLWFSMVLELLLAQHPRNWQNLCSFADAWNVSVTYIHWTDFVCLVGIHRSVQVWIMSVTVSEHFVDTGKCVLIESQSVRAVQPCNVWTWRAQNLAYSVFSLEPFTCAHLWIA